MSFYSPLPYLLVDYPVFFCTECFKKLWDRSKFCMSRIHNISRWYDFRSFRCHLVILWKVHRYQTCEHCLLVCIKNYVYNFAVANLDIYLCQGGNVFAILCQFVCLCVSKITQKVMDGSFWNFEGMSGIAQTTSEFNFGGDSEGILDSRSLWNFRYHCFQWGIRETATKPKMVLLSSKQHCFGGGVRALTAFQFSSVFLGFAF